MKHFLPSLLLLTAVLTGAFTCTARDVNRQKTRTLTLTYKRLRRHPSFLALKKRTCLSRERVTHHSDVLGKELTAFEAQRASYSSDRSTRLYKCRIEDMQELVTAARARPDSFISSLAQEKK